MRSKVFDKISLIAALAAFCMLVSAPASADNISEVGQSGDCNDAIVLQVGENGSYVFQANPGNCTKGNSAIIGQMGNNDQATLQDGRKLSATTIQVGENGSLIIQKGRRDNALTVQDGSNLAATGQLGNDNDAYTRQFGIGNLALTGQLGDNNLSSIDQSGFGNTAVVIQVSPSGDGGNDGDNNPPPIGFPQ